MIAMLLTAATTVVENATEKFPPTSVPQEVIWLTVGCALGALARAFWVKHQEPMSKETTFDCFCAALLGLLWRPVLIDWFGIVPDFRAEWPYLFRAGIMIVVGMAATAVVKRILIEKAPGFVEEKLGAVLPKTIPPPPEDKV